MTKDTHELWARVNAALDERHDPLADEAIQTWIGEHPEDLDEILLLRERLDRIRERPAGARPRPALVRLAAAALVLLVGLAVLLTPPESQEPPQVAAGDWTELPPTCFHELRLTLHTMNGTTSTTTTWSLEDGERTTELVLADPRTRITTSTRGGRP